MKKTASPLTTRTSLFSTPPGSARNVRSSSTRNTSLPDERSPLVHSAALNSLRYLSISSSSDSRLTTEESQTGPVDPPPEYKTYGSISSPICSFNVNEPDNQRNKSNANEYYSKIFSTNFGRFQRPKPQGSSSSSTSSSHTIIVDDNEEDDEVEGEAEKPSTTPFIDQQLQKVNEALSSAMDRIMGRKQTLVDMRNQTGRLDNVTQMFRRNGEVAETEAWVQRVKATSFVELLYFMVVVLGSGVGFLLFFELIQKIAIAVGGTTPTPLPPTTPPATGGQPGAGTPPPSYPYPYPYPPYCQPVPAPPSGGIPPTTPPAGGVPASGTFVITPGLLQLMNFFVFCCVVVYLAKKISKRPSRPLATQEQSCNQLAYEPIR